MQRFRILDVCGATELCSACQFPKVLLWRPSGLIGSAAPYFRVQSGDDKELTLDMIKGKVIAIFYDEQRHCGMPTRDLRMN
jgi:hypothetical protein